MGLFQIAAHGAVIISVRLFILLGQVSKIDTGVDFRLSQGTYLNVTVWNRTGNVVVLTRAATAFSCTHLASPSASVELTTIVFPN